MAVTVKAIIEGTIVQSTQWTQYTANGVTTIIDKFTATNFSASAATLSVNIVKNLDGAGNQNLIVKTVTIAAGATYTFPEIVSQVLNPGDFISTIASVATSINIRASGREIS